jgi:hypothetical protein
MEYWERIKERYDVAFIGAAATILIGIAFIFFTIVVSDWMFRKTGDKSVTTGSVGESNNVNCTGEVNDSKSDANEGNSDSSRSGKVDRDNVTNSDSNSNGLR